MKAGSKLYMIDSFSNLCIQTSCKQLFEIPEEMATQESWSDTRGLKYKDLAKIEINNKASYMYKT